MSAESERDAALEIHAKARDLNRAVDDARLLGLRIDLKAEMTKLDDAPFLAPHIFPFVSKPIDLRDKT